MKPKAKRFRIRRTTPAPTGGPMEAAGHPAATRAEPAERIQRPADGGVEQALAAIREEGLTGRQLRMARRIAQKNGLSPASDLEAVYLLRLKGIDPFQRENALDLMVPSPTAPGVAPGAQARAAKAAQARKAQLPQTLKSATKNLPATDDRSPAERRIQEISAIQEDMAAAATVG